ncbi:hypothetical protein LTR36_007827 [Oleoguttula mirabilis]|uniref:Cleavage/polyadenylation specificity factor A subunit N-terminal domain-containing protein n=1 Tax=Oleoguttula mirabilis TaxID=1507867 RepID=A0AAV9J994_9PEZI|nr:hypothetical protein LTR36_007827 [Oleoguttula mirabilis]
MASFSRTPNDDVVEKRPVGILTRTVIKSPVVRWLLHARLRRKGLNDLVFVGEDVVHVKQVCGDGHLEQIATKADFDARIRAAKIFSIGSEPSDEDILVKTEDGASTKRSTSAPLDLLVLTLDNNDLVFLYLVESGGSVHFVQQACPMPKFDCVLYQPGEHLAVDPHARALAVAANEREVVLYSAKTAQRIKTELSTGYRHWCPVSAQRPLQVEGIIQHMEFLIPPSDDEDHVILLLIVIDQGKTKAIWIEWYFTSDLHRARVHPGQPLDTARTVSGLLIPLRNAAFMIVSGSDVRLWKNLLSGSASGTTLGALEAEPRNSGDSPRQPVWASWCRPRRSRAASRDKDHLYLVREDGLVFLVHAMSESLTSSSAGHFECHVGTAFASLGDTDEPDILAVAGDMSAGRVVSIGHWPNPRVSDLSYGDTMKMDLIETIPNWASATDLITTTTRSPQGRSSRTTQSGAGMLVTSGRQPYGSITELRYGLEARLCAYFPLDGLDSVTGIWVVPVITSGSGRIATGSVLMFFTNPSATRLLSIAEDDDGFEPQELDASKCPALDLTRSTLAVACLPDGRIVQVTTGSVAVTAGLNAHFEDSSKRVCEEHHHILTAVIEPRRSVILTAEQRGDSHFICSVYLPAQGDSDEMTTSADDCHICEGTRALVGVPTAIAAAPIPSGVLAVVGTTDGHLSVFEIGRDNSIHGVCRTTMPRSQDVPTVCDYLVLQQSNDSASILATCALRDGRLHSVIIEPVSGGSYRCGDNHTVDFGSTAVKLVQVPNNRSQACAMSGADTCLLSWDGRDVYSLVISNMWISDKERPELAQGPVVACTQMPQADALAFPELADYLVMVSGDEIFITSIQTSPTTVPRQVPVSGTPNRLLYAEQQRCFVVASTKTAIRSFPTPSSRPEERRQIWPAIDFIPARSDKPTFTYDLQPGQRVHALLEWSFRLDESKSYSFVLVGGTRIRSDGSQGGFVTFLQPINRSWEVVDVKVQDGSRGIRKFDAPVYALALWDELTYVVCYGQYIMLYRFLVKERRWVEVCAPYRLASPGVFVTVAAPLIYVSTMADSLVTLELRLCQTVNNDRDAGADGRLPKLVPVSMGPQAHECLSHLILQPNTPDALALLSTKNGRIIGLTSPSHTSDARPRRHSADILFEARLPRSLTRVRQSDVRPKWKPASPPGVLTDNLIGTAPDGTLVGLALLDGKLWRRLFWLQRLCEWSEHLSPHSFQTPAYDATDVGYIRDERALPIGLSTANEQGDEIVLRTMNSGPEDMHINGDILACILQPGGAEKLRHIIERTAEREDWIGEWVGDHLGAEMAVVDEVVELLQTVLDRWV